MIEALGYFSIRAIAHYGRLLQLLGDTWAAMSRSVWRRQFRFHEIILQCYSAGVQSLPIVGLALAFIGVMLTIEFSYHMKLVIREDSLVPAFATVLMVRELGPVVSCLLLSSRVGAGIAAELGTMRVTDQIDALRILSVDPIDFLVVPRWIGCVFAAVVLSLLSVAVALLAGALLAATKLGYLPSEFFNSMFTFTHFRDLLSCLTKAVIFGSIIPIVASRHGLSCRPGAQGVGDAATAAVVESSVLIIAADFFVTYGLYTL